jgi:hypothetical protein
LVAEVAHAAARAHSGVELSAGIDHAGVALGLVRKGYFLNSHKVRAAAWIWIETLPEIQVISPDLSDFIWQGYARYTVALNALDIPIER